jgi:two-component system response regulator
MIKPILLVEDDENDVFFFEHAMKKEGLLNPLQVASDGQRAIDYLQGGGKFSDRRQFPLPYLVMLDLKLPFVMGLDVLKWIRQQPHLNPIVIVLSSSQQKSDISSAYRLGASAYLVKTPDLAKLQEMVRAIKDFWLTHNILAESSDLDGGAADLPNAHRQTIIPAPYPSKLRSSYETHNFITR